MVVVVFYHPYFKKRLMVYWCVFLLKHLFVKNIKLTLTLRSVLP